MNEADEMHEAARQWSCGDRTERGRQVVRLTVRLPPPRFRATGDKKAGQDVRNRIYLRIDIGHISAYSLRRCDARPADLSPSRSQSAPARRTCWFAARASSTATRSRSGSA